MSWDLEKCRQQGFLIGVGKRVTTGRLLTLNTYFEAVEGLSNLAKLSDYSEVAIEGINGAPYTYIATSCLINQPQVIIGYQESGLPLLLGVTKVLQGHGSICGASRSGKTTSSASISYQLNRLGYCCLTIVLKANDVTHYSANLAAAESKTHFTADGQLDSVPYRFLSLNHRLPTSGFNYFDHLDEAAPQWQQVARMLLALGQSQGGDQDPARVYFLSAAQQFLEGIPMEESFANFIETIKKRKTSREERYAVSGSVNQIRQQAAIVQHNLPKGHPANVDLEDMIRARGAILFDAFTQGVGDVGSAAAALFAEAFISAKRNVDPTENSLAFLIIDEAQVFPRTFLRRLIEQAASLGIRVIFLYHSLEQLGDDWETLSMTQLRLFFSAVPGGLTDRHLQAQFGTKKSYRYSFGAGTSTSIEGLLPIGAQIDPMQEGLRQGVSENYGFAEYEENAWSPNDTLKLNNDPRLFVCQVAPGAELAQFGPSAIRCISGGPPIPFSEINRLSPRIHEDRPHEIKPVAARRKALTAKEVESAQRSEFIAKLSAAASQIRNQL